jgi:5-methylcytosine-specific restriction endonuclease McrA
MINCLICNSKIIKSNSKNNNQKYCSDCLKIHLKEYRRINSAKWYEKNKDKRKLYMILPHMIYFFIKRNAKNRNIKFNITKEDFINWYNKQDKICYYCERTLTKIQSDKKEKEQYKGRLSIDRKDNNKGYEIDNIVLACGRCNIIKGDYFTKQEMKRIGKLIYKLRNE